MIHFTSTATRTPELVEPCFRSFAQNLCGVELDKCRLFLNIDPVPADRTSTEVIRIAASYFGDVVVNEPMEPSFPKAVKWCFSQPDPLGICVHIEADWELLQPVNVPVLSMISRGVLNLRAHAHFGQTKRCFLSPGIWRSAAMRMVGDGLDGESNPEVNLWRLTDHLRCGHYYGDRVLVRDLGRQWQETSGYVKDTPKPVRGIHHWTKWVKK